MSRRPTPDDPYEWLNRAHSDLLLASSRPTGVYSGERIPLAVQTAQQLTRFAVFTRYPGIGPSIGEREYKQAVRSAQGVLRREERLVGRAK